MALREGTGLIQDLDKEKDKKKTITRKIRGVDVTTTVPDDEVGGLTAAAAGVGSGVIKTVEGVVSLGAELMDAFGMSESAAMEVEELFDRLNPLEEIAEQRAVGKLTQALIQIGIPAAAGAKIATKLATKALKAKRTGKYANVLSKNAQKGIKQAKKLNELTGKQRFGAIVLGGAAGETLVTDTEDIGSFGDVFEAGPTQLDREEREDPQEDATRKLMNRFKWGTESLFTTPFVYGVGAGAKA